MSCVCCFGRALNWVKRFIKKFERGETFLCCAQVSPLGRVQQMYPFVLVVLYLCEPIKFGKKESSGVSVVMELKS